MFGRKKKAQNDGVYGSIRVTMKGLAISAAIDSGLCEKSEDGDGWDIGPFMAFWDKFEPMLKEHLAEGNGLTIS